MNETDSGADAPEKKKKKLSYAKLTPGIFRAKRVPCELCGKEVESPHKTAKHHFCTQCWTQNHRGVKELKARGSLI